MVTKYQWTVASSDGANCLFWKEQYLFTVLPTVGAAVKLATLMNDSGTMPSMADMQYMALNREACARQFLSQEELVYALHEIETDKAEIAAHYESKPKAQIFEIGVK